jgi:predicted alpha/beta superfamily hydrolase
MFDGQNVFFDSDATYGKCWGMKEYMDFTDTEVIIAAVECNRSPDNGRLREYSPFPFKDLQFGEFPGWGKKTMDWMSRTFKEDIDRNFRTLPDRENTFLAGSSMGGLMSLYGVLKYNKVYSRAAALSPSLWVDPGRLERLIRQARLKKDTVVYMDYGSEELNNHADMVRLFGETASLLMERGVLVSSRIVPGGTHSEGSWEKQIPFFMNTLLYEG